MQDMTMKLCLASYPVDMCCKHVGILCSETILKSVSDRLQLLPYMEQRLNVIMM